ncbi:putative reverse transcriptase domain-containing protein [Tanacetum coccineum]|uniref:Reverse transcriptase domain-containing protein n=1 Tax=Tanacetum coccineum TaxID=301880 RepID=A0ABQ4ZF09_9ASTR
MPQARRMGPRVVNPLNARNPTTARGACFECGGTDHYKATCSRLNRAPRPGGNRPNQAMVIEGGQGHGNNGNQARGRAFMMGAEEARQDPNIVTDLEGKHRNAPILALPDGPEDFVVYYDAAGLGLGCVLMQRDKVIAYASR